MARERWYKDLVFYQIWPRSFKDGNGDGMGDLWGVYEKLDYLQSLGVDGVWFSPLYPSPGADCGYDISDYMDIDPMYGGMEAFRRVLDGLHARGMKLIMDLVVNHTSDEHEWFQKSRRRIEPYTDYYIWRPAGKNGKLPNNWDSNFEGKAWQWDDLRQEYYLHLFAIKQPDLNMDNPLVREEVKKILRFWLDMGVDGFREDVITYISKREGLPNDRLFPAFRGIRFYNHGPHIHEYLQEFRRDVFDHYSCMTLAEAPLVSPKRALEYIAEDGPAELDMMIQFQCMCADCYFTDYFPRPFSLRRLRSAFGKWQRGLSGRAWNMLYLENNDHPRVISRYGSEAGAWHDELASGERGAVRGCADAQSVSESQGRKASQASLARLARFRADARTVVGGEKRGLQRSHTVVLCQPKLSADQRCRAGGRPGFPAEFLPQGNCAAKAAARSARGQLPRALPSFRQALCLCARDGGTAAAGCLLVYGETRPFPCAEGLPAGADAAAAAKL